jgi:hypothetical protein
MSDNIRTIRETHTCEVDANSTRSGGGSFVGADPSAFRAATANGWYGVDPRRSLHSAPKIGCPIRLIWLPTPDQDPSATTYGAERGRLFIRHQVYQIVTARDRFRPALTHGIVVAASVLMVSTAAIAQLPTLTSTPVTKVPVPHVISPFDPLPPFGCYADGHVYRIGARHHSMVCRPSADLTHSVQSPAGVWETVTRKSEPR